MHGVRGFHGHHHPGGDARPQPRPSGIQRFDFQPRPCCCDVRRGIWVHKPLGVQLQRFSPNR